MIPFFGHLFLEFIRERCYISFCHIIKCDNIFSLTVTRKIYNEVLPYSKRLTVD